MSFDKNTYIAILLSAITLYVGYYGMHSAEAMQRELAAQKEDTIVFKWVPTVAGRTAERVTSESVIVIPFEFGINGSMPKVKFMISKEYEAYGVRIKKETSEVKGGKAGSEVVFNILRGMPLGRHNLVIRVTDPSTGAEIGSGTIPFILLPSAFECMC